MSNVIKVGIIGVGIVGVVASAYTRYLHIKVNELLAVIESSADGLSKDISVNVSDAIIEKAVSRAVDREVGKAIKSISYDVTSTVRNDIHKEVKTSVDAAYSHVRSSVTDEVARQVANMDMNKLREEVKNRANELVVEKFDANLNGLLEEFNGSLSNVSKIYSSIADSMTKKKDSEMTFKIGN